MAYGPPRTQADQTAVANPKAGRRMSNFLVLLSQNTRLHRAAFEERSPPLRIVGSSRNSLLIPRSGVVAKSQLGRAPCLD